MQSRKQLLSDDPGDAGQGEIETSFVAAVEKRTLIVEVIEYLRSKVSIVSRLRSPLELNKLTLQGPHCCARLSKKKAK